VTAGVAVNGQVWDGAVRYQHVIDGGIRREREDGNSLQRGHLRGGWRQIAEAGEVRAGFGNGCIPVECCHWLAPFPG
jgi:hypothetical protein